MPAPGPYNVLDPVRAGKEAMSSEADTSGQAGAPSSTAASSDAAPESAPGAGLDPAELPRHVAVIMDGNGRWARQRGLTRLAGHRRGADVVREITTFARELGIGYLTMYSFSAQNWSRPAAEVAGLMQLLEDYCARELPTLIENQIRLQVIGGLQRLPASTRQAVRATMQATAGHQQMVLTLALDYGGREELLKAFQRLAARIEAGELSSQALDEACISAALDTGGMPDPDLVIRTSGEMRVSNFLLWQIAYAELHFTRVCWPDFSREDFAEALREYGRRERRFGATEPLSGDPR